MKMSEELKRKIGQLFMVGVPDNSLPDEYVKLCEKYYIGNFTLNADNCISIDTLCKAISSLRKNTYRATKLYPFVEVDQEGGWVTRIYEGAAMISGEMSFAASGADEAKMKKEGAKLGKIMRNEVNSTSFTVTTQSDAAWAGAAVGITLKSRTRHSSKDKIRLFIIRLLSVSIQEYIR